MWSPTQIESNPQASAVAAISRTSGQRTSRSTSGSCTPTSSPATSIGRAYGLNFRAWSGVRRTPAQASGFRCRQKTMMGPAHVTSQLRPDPPKPARRRFRLHRPRKSRRFFTGVALLALGLAAATTGFGHALTRTERVAAFTSSGSFAYRTQAPATGAAAVRFDYRFHSRRPHAVHGTIALQELFVADPGWRDTYRLAAAQPFSGDHATVTASL